MRKQAGSVALVDSNVIIDLLNQNSEWMDWALVTIARMRKTTALVINPLIYAEISVHFDTPEELEEVVSPHLFGREKLPFEAAFLAGKCFRKYRRRRGAKTSPLPDFYIGAHAAVMEWSLLTRDETYRTYFPELKIISPASFLTQSQ